MARPYKVHTTRIDRINLKRFQMAIAEAYSAPPSELPLNASKVKIYGGHRTSEVSIYRGFKGNTELLITDWEGRYLFYGFYDVNLGIERIAELYYETFLRLRKAISKMSSTHSNYARDVKFSICQTAEEKWELMLKHERENRKSDPVLFKPIFDPQSHAHRDINACPR